MNKCGGVQTWIYTRTYIVLRTTCVKYNQPITVPGGNCHCFRVEKKDEGFSYSVHFLY